MNPFALDPLDQQNQIANATLNPGDLSDSLGFFEGSGAAIMGGAEKFTARLKYDIFANDLQDPQAAEKYRQQLKTLRPDPTTMGTGAEALFNIVDTVGTYIFGGVAKTDIPFLPAVPGLNAIMASQPFYSSQLEVNRSQYNEQTAQDVTANETAFAALGASAPASLAGSLPVRMLSGAAINGALGATERGLTSKILMENGYKDMAAQYQAADAGAVMADLAIGAIFGVFGEGPGTKKAAAAARIKPSDLDAALALNNGGHFQTTAPGIPVDEATLNAHVASTEKALRDLMLGDTVDVSKTFTSDNMIIDPIKTAHADSVRAQVMEHVDLPAIERNYASAQERLPVEVPGSVLGAESAVKVGREYLPVRWALVDAADVEATMTKADNQYRDRQRASSQAQVAEIANAPDYNLLNNAAIMDFGAPTLTRQGLIVGGNGRFAGISKAYDQGTAGTYTAPLLKDLEQYGIDPAKAEGMKKPVLVRILETDVDTKKAAIASNEGGGLGMSDLEQSKVDSERMGSTAGLQIDLEGNFNTPSNMDLIRNMVAKFPTNEKAAFLDADGRLSAAGVRRVRNAILYKAYGDSPTLARLIESTDPGAKNVANALLRTATIVAEVKDAIAAGRLYPLDISTDIASAVETLDRLRTDKMKVADYLNQSQMFDSDLTIEARKILQFLDEYIRSSRTMADMITTYYEGVKAAGDPAQVDMLRSEPPTKGELLDAAIAKTGKDFVPELAELPFNQKDNTAIEQRFMDRVNNDYKTLVKEYENLPDSHGGKIIDTDVARELAPEYISDRTLAAAVHEPASTFVKKLYADKLSKPTPKGSSPVVLFTAGGTGAGKSSGRSLLGPDLNSAEIVYDSTMSSFASADKKIQQALEAGRTAVIMYVYRDPVDALVNGALKRATSQEKQFGSGRTTRIKDFAEMHAGSRKTIVELAEKYKDDQKVKIIIIDNSKGSKPELSSIAKLPEMTYNDVERSLYEALRTERQSEKISKSIYDGFNDQVQSGRVGSESSPGVSEQSYSGSERQQPEIGQLDKPTNPDQLPKSDMFSAQAIVQERPDLTIGDGEGGLIKASDALAQADEIITIAQREAKAFDVAAQCALME